MCWGGIGFLYCVDEKFTEHCGRVCRSRIDESLLLHQAIVVLTNAARRNICTFYISRSGVLRSSNWNIKFMSISYFFTGAATVGRARDTAGCNVPTARATPVAARNLTRMIGRARLKTTDSN